jgi:hypothetical protein
VSVGPWTLLGRRRPGLSDRVELLNFALAVLLVALTWLAVVQLLGSGLHGRRRPR